MSARLIGVLAAMAALLGAALSTGTRVYYVLFAVLGLMVICGFLSVVITLLSVKCGIKGVKQRCVRGDKMMIILNVQHACPLLPGSLRISLSVPGGREQEISVDSLPFMRRNFRNVVKCMHRGDYEVGISRITAQDLFGLFEFSRKSSKKPLKMEVCPRAMDLPLMELKASDIGPEFKSRATEDASSPSGIRKWQDGDELKRVHWKLSMRKQELMVRTFEESARPDTLVIPDLSAIPALKEEKLTLEDALCEAALGAAKAQLEAGYPVRMPLQSAMPREYSGRTNADLPSFADALMRVAFDSPYPYEQVLMLLSQRMQRTGGAVLITGRVTTRTVDIALRMLRRGMQIKLIWITDAARSESMEMLERLKMAGAQVVLIDPWAADAVPAAVPESADDAQF